MTLTDSTQMPLPQCLRTELPGIRINKLPRADYEKDPSQSLTCRSCYEDCDTGEVYCVITESTISGNRGDWAVAMFRCPSCGPHKLNSLSHYRAPSAIVRVSTRREGPWLVIDRVKNVRETRTD